MTTNSLCFYSYFLNIIMSNSLKLFCIFIFTKNKNDIHDICMMHFCVYYEDNQSGKIYV